MFGRDYPPRPYFQIKKSAISIFSLVPGLLYPHQTNFAWFENPLLYVVEEFEKACISAEVKKLQKSPKKKNSRKTCFSYLSFTLIHVEESVTFIHLCGFLENYT